MPGRGRLVEADGGRGEGLCEKDSHLKRARVQGERAPGN